MRLIPPLLGAIALLSPVANALNILRSTSLSPCMERSGFSATLFNVSFTPGDGQLRINIKGGSTIIGEVMAKVTVLAYGFPVMSQSLDPCTTEGLRAMCPMTLLPLDLNFQQTIDKKTVNQIPVIAYKIPDLDGVARMEVVDRTSGAVVACVEAPLSNGQTVEQAGVGWASAVISGLAIIASAVVSGMGYSNTAAHIAANALSLFGYFQSQAMVAMMAVPLPPLAAAWAQNFDWSVGIINIGFMQKIFHWYIQATSGHTANLFKQQDSISVSIAKRSLSSSATFLSSRAAFYGFAETTTDLEKRSNNAATTDSPDLVSVTGMERMSYKAKIERTNFFMTGISFFVAFAVLVVILVGGFRMLCNTKMVKRDRFRDFRAKWLAVLKGIMYRVMFIGFPSMAVLSIWELYHRDSPAAATLAAFFLVSMIVTLGWACFRILTIGKHSNNLDRTLGPAYTLYSDPAAINRWGYLYVQFRTERYYYIVPMLVYIFAKALTIGLAQQAGVAQSIVVMVLEVGYLVAVCMLRPWLDRRTNIVNIGIAAVNFINSVMVMVFSGVTGAPNMIAGIMGVIFFIMNAVFALVLLVLLAFAVGFALFSKNPESRYRDATALSTDEKKGARDLDAEPTVPTTTIGEPPLHDLGSRNLDSRGAESERAVGLERGLSARNQRSPPAMWEQPRSSQFESAAAAAAARSTSIDSSRAPSTRQFENPRPFESPRPPRSFEQHRGMYEPSVASGGRPSMQSQRSRRTQGGGGGGFAVPSAAMYEERQRTQQQAPDWNRGVGFDR